MHLRAMREAGEGRGVADRAARAAALTEARLRLP